MNTIIENQILSHIFPLPVCIHVHVYLFSYYFLKASACKNGKRYLLNLLHCAIAIRTHRDPNQGWIIFRPPSVLPPLHFFFTGILTSVVKGDQMLNPRLWSHLLTFYTVKVAPHSRNATVIKFLFLRQTNSECTHSLLSQHDCTEIVSW